MILDRRRLTAAASACVLLMVGGTAAIAAPLAPTGSVAVADMTAETTSAPLVIATYNIRHALSNATAVSDISKLADSGVGVMAFQEMGSRKRRDAVARNLVDCGSCEYDAYMPNGSGPGELPILYKSANLRLLSSGILKLSDATYVGSSGAGPSTIAAKYLTYVELRHRVTGQELYVINNHAVASVQGPGGGPNRDHPERLQLYRKHMNGLKAMVTGFKATGAAVFAVGDLNVNYRRDVVIRDDLFPYANMSEVGMSASYQELGTPEGGTHTGSGGDGDRIIDYVAGVEHEAVTAKAQTILTGYRSDHRPVKVRYSIGAGTAAPTGVRAEPGERSAAVSWAPAPGAAATAYTVTASPGGAQLTTAVAATSATMPSLAVGTSYTFTIRAKNGGTTGPTSSASNAVTPYAVLPETTITSGPVNRSFLTSTGTSMGYSSSEPGSSFGCLLDGAGRPCDSSSVRLSSLAGTTHVFTVAARDGDGDVDSSPATRRWTVPMDDTAMTRAGGWSRETGWGFYQRTYSQTTKRDAVLSTRVSGMRKLALVATTGPGHGAVQVFLGSTLLKRVDLDSGVMSKKRLLPIARFSEGRTGRVRVVVVSSGRIVRVEGLGVATS